MLLDGWILRKWNRSLTGFLSQLDAGFSSKTVTKGLSTAQMQMVEIAGPLTGFNVLALDEPNCQPDRQELRSFLPR